MQFPLTSFDGLDSDNYRDVLINRLLTRGWPLHEKIRTIEDLMNSIDVRIGRGRQVFDLSNAEKLEQECERVLLDFDFTDADDADGPNADDDEHDIFGARPKKDLRNEAADRVLQVVECEDVLKAKKQGNQGASALISIDECERDRDSRSNKRMLKVTLTDGYEEIICIERRKMKQFLEWETRLVPGTKVLLKNVARGGNNVYFVGDDEDDFVILGGVVHRLKAKYFETMRKKSLSEFADDGFSLAVGIGGKAPKFQPFDKEKWKELERERQVREQKEREEKKEEEKKEKREKIAREKIARVELGHLSIDDVDEEENLELFRARRPKLPPKKRE